MSAKPPAIHVMSVPSESNPDVMHEVRISRMDGKLYCTCAGWRMRKRCRHTDEITKDNILDALAKACETGVLGI